MLYCSLQTFGRLLDGATGTVMDVIYSRSSCFLCHYQFWKVFIRDLIFSVKILVMVKGVVGVGATRASDIGIDGEFPRNHLLEKVESKI